MPNKKKSKNNIKVNELWIDYFSYKRLSLNGKSSRSTLNI